MIARRAGVKFVSSFGGFFPRGVDCRGLLILLTYGVFKLRSKILTRTLVIPFSSTANCVSDVVSFVFSTVLATMSWHLEYIELIRDQLRHNNGLGMFP